MNPWDAFYGPNAGYALELYERRQLREAKDFGLESLDYIIANRTEYDSDFRKDYLGWHIHYYLGDDEKRGLAKFMELLRKHGFGPVYEPRFVA